jgi:hypothetical protein
MTPHFTRLSVLHEGPRTDEILDHLAAQLELDRATLRRDGAGLITIPFEGHDAPRAWDRVAHVLDEAGPDWHRHLALAPRPTE